jgi:hypothetical protein
MQIGNSVWINGEKSGRIIGFRDELILIKYDMGLNKEGTVYIEKERVTPRNSRRLTRSYNGTRWSARGKGRNTRRRKSRNTRRRRN